MANSGKADWSTGLFDCFSDCSLCCQTTICPCITFGRNAEIIQRGSISCAGNCLLYMLLQYVSGCLINVLFGCVHRSNLRKEFGLKESPCPDFCVHCFCHCCALCQEYRQLQHQGFDMKLGYDANVQRQNRGATMAPVTEGGMKR